MKTKTASNSFADLAEWVRDCEHCFEKGEVPFSLLRKVVREGRKLQRKVVRSVTSPDTGKVQATEAHWTVVVDDPEGSRWEVKSDGVINEAIRGAFVPPTREVPAVVYEAAALILDHEADSLRRQRKP